MTLHEAVSLNIRRIRRPVWDENSYIKLHVVDGMMGPWAQLYDRKIQEPMGTPTPQQTFAIGDTTDDYVEYVGELDRNDFSSHQYLVNQGMPRMR